MDHPSVLKHFYMVYRSNSARKGREKVFELTLGEFLVLVKSDCFYCGSAPRKRVYQNNVAHANGIDRRDNSVGYVKDNCIPCCTNCNFLKGTLGFEEFLEMIKSISKHQGK